MADTKIINVQKDDSFEAVFNEFEGAEASEIILIIPKGSKLAKREEHFAVLAEAAAASDCTVTLMTADPTAHGYASKYGFKLLSTPARASGTKPQIRVVPSAKPAPNNEKDSIPINLPIADDEAPMVIPLSVSTEPPAGPVIAELTVARGAQANPPIRVDEEFQAIRPRRLYPAEENEALESDWLKKSSAQNGGSGLWGGIKATSTSGNRRSGRPKRKKWYWGLGGFIVLCGILYFSLGSAQVVIRPQTEEVNFVTKVSLSEDFKQVDSTLGQLPGKYLSVDKTISRSYPASESKQVVQKARGEATVYNNFSSEAQPLVATTRFATADGLIFRIPQSITIPGAKTIAGKTVPGKITVPLIADKAGEEYNVGPSKFTIPGFKGGSKYEAFYAESTAAMVGGKVGQAKVISESDLTVGKADATAAITNEVKTALTSQAGDLKIIDTTSPVIDLKSNAEAGDSFDELIISAHGTAGTIAVASQTEKDFVTAYISKNGSRVLLPDDLQLTYSDPHFDSTTQVLIASLAVKGRSAAKLNSDKISIDLLGQNQTGIKNYFWGNKDIDSVKVFFSPFWVHSIPQNKAKLELKVEY